MAEDGLAECCPEVPLSPGKKPWGTCWIEVSESVPQIQTLEEPNHQAQRGERGQGGDTGHLRKKQLEAKHGPCL